MQALIKMAKIKVSVLLMGMLLIITGARGCPWLNEETVSGSSAPLPSAASHLTAGGYYDNVYSIGRITLNWQDNSNNEDGFKIERSTDGINFIQIAVMTADVVYYQDAPLTRGITYYYRVYAYNDNGDSMYSNIASDTVPNQ